MKNLLFTLLFLTSLTVSAQLNVSTDLSIIGDPSETDIELKYSLELQGQDSVWVHWEIILGEDTPILGMMSIIFKNN